MALLNGSLKFIVSNGGDVVKILAHLTSVPSGSGGFDEVAPHHMTLLTHCSGCGSTAKKTLLTCGANPKKTPTPFQKQHRELAFLCHTLWTFQLPRARGC